MMVGLRDMDHAGAVLSPFIERIAVILVGLLIHACKKIDDIPFDYFCFILCPFLGVNDLGHF